MYGLQTTTQPASEPVSLTLAKVHLAVDHAADDAMITAYIQAARELTEKHTGKRWITQSVLLTLDDFANPIEIPISPVASVTSVKYTDVDGAEQTVASTDWQVALWDSPPKVSPSVDAVIWPTVGYGYSGGVRVVFVAGGAADAVPAMAKAAMLLCIGNWYENRADQNVLIASGIPPAAKALLDMLWTGSYV